MPERANFFVSILSAAALAFVASTAPTLAARDGRADATLEGFRPVTVAPKQKTGDTVIKLLLPYIGNHPESMEGRPTLDLSIRKDGRSLLIDLHLGGYLDDSVAGAHYRGLVIPSPEGWELVSLGVKPVCARGSLSKDGKCP